MRRNFTADMRRELIDALVEGGMGRRRAVEQLKHLDPTSLLAMYDEMKRHRAAESPKPSSLDVVQGRSLDEVLSRPEVRMRLESKGVPLVQYGKPVIGDRSAASTVDLSKSASADISPPPSLLSQKPRKSRKVTYSFKIDPGVLERLRERAEVEERDVSDLIRLAINYYLKRGD